MKPAGAGWCRGIVSAGRDYRREGWVRLSPGWVEVVQDGVSPHEPHPIIEAMAVAPGLGVILFGEWADSVP